MHYAIFFLLLSAVDKTGQKGLHSIQWGPKFENKLKNIANLQCGCQNSTPRGSVGSVIGFMALKPQDFQCFFETFVDKTSRKNLCQ